MNEKDNNNTPQQEYSLNDDRRVKVLSPGRLVMQRFIRNRVAVTGLIILAFMFVFSFIGGWISPYTENQLFYREDNQNKQLTALSIREQFILTKKKAKISTPYIQEARKIRWPLLRRALLPLPPAMKKYHL